LEGVPNRLQAGELSPRRFAATTFRVMPDKEGSRPRRRLLVRFSTGELALRVSRGNRQPLDALSATRVTDPNPRASASVLLLRNPQERLVLDRDENGGDGVVQPYVGIVYRSVEKRRAGKQGRLAPIAMSPP